CSEASMTHPSDASAAVLARIEAGSAEVLAGRPARELSRDLAALAHVDPLRVTAEASTVDDVRLVAVFGVDCVWFDVGVFVLCDPVGCCVLVLVVSRRAGLLEALRGTIAELAAPLVATPLDVIVALGTQPARTLFPAVAHRVVDAAI